MFQIIQTTIASKWIQTTLTLLLALTVGCGGGDNHHSNPVTTPSATENSATITGVIQDRFEDGSIRVNDITVRLPPQTLTRDSEFTVGVPVRIVLSHESGASGPITVKDEGDDDDDDEPHEASDIDVIDCDDEEVTVKGLVTSLSSPNFTINTTFIMVGPDTEFELRDETGVIARTRTAFYNNLVIGARAEAEGHEAEEGVLADEVTVWLGSPVVTPPPPTLSSSPIILAGPVSEPFDASTSRFSILTVPIQISATTIIQLAPDGASALPIELLPGRRVACHGDLVNGVVQARLINLDAGPEPGGVLINAPLETLTVATHRATALGLTLALDRGVRLISPAGIALNTASTLAQWRTGDRIVALGIPKASQPSWVQASTASTTLDSAQTAIPEQSPVEVIAPIDQSYDPALENLVVAGQTFQITAETTVTLDQSVTPVAPASLTAGTAINLRGVQLNGRLTAEKIEVLTTPPTHTTIAGPYDAFDPITRRFTVLGHTVEYSGTTLFYDFAGLQVSLSDFVLAAPLGTVILATGARDTRNVLRAVRLNEIVKIYSASVASGVKVAATLSEPFNLATLSLGVAGIPVAANPTITVHQPDGTPAQAVSQLITGDPVVINGRLGQAGFVADDIVRLPAVTGAVALTGPTQSYDTAKQTFFLLGQALRITPATAVNTIGMPPATADDLVQKLTPWTRLHVLTRIPTPDPSNWDALAIEARLFFPHPHPGQVTGQITSSLDSATGILNVLGATVSVNAQTRVTNVGGAPMDPATLTPANVVTVMGQLNSSDTLTAESIQVIDAASSWSPQLNGPTRWTNPANQTLNVLGGTITVTPSTRLLESVTVALTAAEFWTGIASHSVLQVRGTSSGPTNGNVTAEEILVVRY